MSGVIEAKRSLSKMQFYTTAVEIRNELTSWLLTDFGMNRKKKRINVKVPMTEEDKSTIQSIIDKYDVNNDKWYTNEYPEWFATQEKNYLTEILRDIMANIISANTIYVGNDMSAYEMRRNYTNEAIACCYKLYQELDYITTLFPSDLNRLVKILEKIEKEIDLLRGWRKSVKKPKI